MLITTQTVTANTRKRNWQL